MQFKGRDRKDAKRKALSYWHSHSRELGLSLREFLTHCRIGPKEKTIVFSEPQA
jgi:hypothetical protein